MAKRRAVAQIGTKFRASAPSLDWLGRIEAGARAYLAADPDRPGAVYLRLAEEWVGLAREAVAEGNAEAAAAVAMAALQAAWQAEIAEGRWLIDMGAKSSRAHAKAASAPRKLSEATRTKILAAYDERVASGKRRGAIKALAREFGVVTKTVSDAIKGR